MESLIKNAKNLGIFYGLSSSTLYQDSSSYLRENALEDSSSFFLSKQTPKEQWFQISFSSPVLVSSYILKSNVNYWPTEWLVNISFDNSSWETVDHQENRGKGDNTPFILDKPVNCLHFRIVKLKNYETSSNYFYLKINFFDCFGTKGKMKASRNMCSRYVSYLKYKLMHYVFVISLSTLLYS